MGFFDRFTGTRRPDAGVPIVAPDQLREKLLGLNRPTAPWQVRDGAPEGVDLVAEWKIVDASWYQIFAKAGLQKTFKILMCLDTERQELRASDETQSVSWQAGIPSVSREVEVRKGQQYEMSFGSAYAFTEQGHSGEVYRYRFNSNEVKKPLKQAVTDAGWTYRAVPFGKL